jgi:hypothetical protein
MEKSAGKLKAIGDIDTSVLIWLLALSFWSGVTYMQVLHNSNSLEKNYHINSKIFDRLNDIDKRLSIIQGKINH